MIEKTFKNINYYQKALEASWLKNEVISNNIANVNTPGYKRKDVQFESVLKQQLNNKSIKLYKTHPKHLSSNTINGNLDPKIITEFNTSFRKDENNVNIDTEMAELSKNTIKFNALVQQLNKQLNRIKLSITDGRK